MTRKGRGNIPAGKVQRAFYLPTELAGALRVEAAKRNESQSAIVERALRKELNMMALTWRVVEDNAGGLHLAVLEDGKVIYYRYGYEQDDGDGLRSDLGALRSGVDPREDGWDMPQDVDDPQRWYDELRVGQVNGGVVVADQDGVYVDKMGAAAHRVFSGGKGLALALGFDTYDDLLTASRSIIREGAADWYVTPLPTGQWAAWDDSEVALDRCAIFATCEEAVRFHVADYLDGTADWEEDVDPGWDGSGTIAQSWTTSVVVYGEEFTVRIDRFKESEGGGVAYSVIRDGDYLPGGENMDAASRSDAEEQAATLIARRIAKAIAKDRA